MGPVRLAFGALKRSHSRILNDEACLRASKAVLGTCLPQRQGRQTSAAQGCVIPNPDGRTAAGQGGVARAAARALRLAAQLLLPAEVAADACAVRTLPVRSCRVSVTDSVETERRVLCLACSAAHSCQAGDSRCLRQA